MEVTKVFCDVCKEEMPRQSNQISAKSFKFKSHVFAFVISAYEDRNDVCTYCLIDMANTFDDRERLAEVE